MDRELLQKMTENFDAFAATATEKEIREAIEMTELYASTEDSKFHLYDPAPVARLYHASPAKIRAVFGGNRSSKTYSHITDYSAQFTGVEPASLRGLMPAHRLDPTRRLRLCMGDYPNSFTKVIWPCIKQLVPSNYIMDVVKDSGRIKAITNRYGGYIEFMQYDQDVSKFMGASLHSVGYDEEPPEDIRDENLMRLVDTDGEETFSLTPLSGALKYLYRKVFMKRGREVEKLWEFILDKHDRLIDVRPGEMIDKMIPGEKQDQDIHCFFANIFDNPGITRKAAIRILSKFPKEELIVRGKGHFLFRSGLVYSGFSDTTHLVEPFTDWYEGPTSGDYSLYLAIDPHPRTPHAVTFMVVDKNNTMYVVDEIFEDCTADVLVKKIQEQCHGKVPEDILIDPIATTPDPSTKSRFAWDLVEYGLVPAPYPGSKNKERGIIMTRKALTPMKNGVPDPTGKPSLYFTHNCANSRYEISCYAWDDWRKHDQNTKGEKQEPIKKNDHFMENLRRLVLHRPEWQSLEELEDTYEHELVGTGRSATTGY